MRSAAAILSGLAVILTAGAAMAARPPVVVELFTAQGCSSCGPANASVAALAARDDVLPLTFSVDYWDYLGWKDTFAQKAFTDRQRAYAKKLGVREVYTPQVVIDGKAQVSGVRPAQVETLMQAQARAPMNPPDMEWVGENRAAVGSGRAPAGGAEVWLVRFDARDQEVAVRRGDNRGQTIEHRNVVRQLVRLGPWAGRPRMYRLPPPVEDGLTSAILVQGAAGGAMIGVMVEEAEAKADETAAR
jgi:hypothetical protein